MKAIIIGASSGIGKALAMKLSQEGYILGLTARRMDLLKDLSTTLKTQCYIKQMDVADFEHSSEVMQNLLGEMGKVDLVVIAAGTGFLNHELDFPLEKKTFDVNAIGFVQLACLTYNHFVANGGGHLVGISSISMHRGNPGAPAYNASKALISNYMEGLRLKALKNKHNIAVTDIRPGYVDTDMARGSNMFWVAPVTIAAQQIFAAIRRKKKVAYITRRWALVAKLFQILPDRLFLKWG